MKIVIIVFRHPEVPKLMYFVPQITQICSLLGTFLILVFRSARKLFLIFSLSFCCFYCLDLFLVLTVLFYFP